MSDKKPTERASMGQVTMNKAGLIEAIKKNRDLHTATLDEALTAYKEKAIEELEDYIERIRDGAVEEVFVRLPAPQNHFADYDRAIAQLEFEIHDTVVLSAGEFDMYVRDNWQWKAGFTATNSLYTNS